MSSVYKISVHDVLFLWLPLLLAIILLIEKSLAAESNSHEPALDNSRALRVCADPNNLPFSNREGEGFENALARLIASDLHKQVEYTWWPQRRGFIRNTLAARRCDVVMGIPADYALAAPTRPYYRSSYAIVTRADLAIDSLDDPRLQRLRIGLHAIGDDYANPPPAQALARRGIHNNIRGYPLYGDYSKAAPSRELIDAVARGDIDVGIAWGPIAGFFAANESQPLRVRLLPEFDAIAAMPMQFAIALGVRRDDEALKQKLNAELENRRIAIDALLDRFHIPRSPGGGHALQTADAAIIER